MEMNWQVVVAVLVVGIAVWHLMRRALAVLHAPGRHSCGGCSKCPDPDEKQVTLVRISHGNHHGATESTEKNRGDCQTGL